jgi:hypothetical protein
MSTHEAIALGERTSSNDGPDNLSRIAVYDDAGRGEYYLSVFEGHREVIAPRLATEQEREELTRGAALVLPVAEFVQHANVAVGCARRAVAIAARGGVEPYSDVTPIYVRLAEAEVRLQQRTNA